MKPISKMSLEERTSAIVQIILEAVVSLVHPDWYRVYKATRDQITDKTDLMRIDIVFSQKVGTIRKLGALLVPPGEIRKKAEEIASMGVDEIYGATTQYGASIVAVQLVVISIKAYASEQDRNRNKNAKGEASVITVQDFDRVIRDWESPNRYLSFTGQEGKHFGTRDEAREAISSQSVAK